VVLLGPQNRDDTASRVAQTEVPIDLAALRQRLGARRLELLQEIDACNAGAAASEAPNPAQAATPWTIKAATAYRT
jgi:hypothetical protein